MVSKQLDAVNKKGLQFEIGILAPQKPCFPTTSPDRKSLILFAGTFSPALAIGSTPKKDIGQDSPDPLRPKADSGALRKSSVFNVFCFNEIRVACGTLLNLFELSASCILNYIYTASGGGPLQ